MNAHSRLRTLGRRGAAVMLLLLALFTSAAPALADPYDSAKSGHPLRVTAYILHPIGVVIDVLIFRPAHWVVRRDGLRTLFGHSEK